MSSRLRSLDSKISFFAFADIITAVSGVLIFVALLLATDLGRPESDRSGKKTAASEREIEATLAEQVAVDAQNQRLESLLAVADTAPDAEKLKADIGRLRGELAQEQGKQAAAADQMSASQTAIAARDRALGLTDLNADIHRLLQETESIAGEEARAHGEMEELQKQVVHTETQLDKLRQREKQVWLIPEKGTNSKAPIFVTVSGKEVVIELLDHPGQRQVLGAEGTDGAQAAQAGFEKYLHGANPQNQYVLFLVRPSGIPLFKDYLRTLARVQGFEVGFDALEEDRQVHFSAPPPLDDAAPAVDQPAPRSVTNGSSGLPGIPAPAVTPSVSATANPGAPARAVPPASAGEIKKSWWERLLEWLGLRPK